MPFVYKVNDRVFEGNIKGYREAQVFANQAAGVIEQFRMVIPHPNAEVIKAWADGMAVQWYSNNKLEWMDYDFNESVGPWYTGATIKWRVMPDAVLKG